MDLIHFENYKEFAKAIITTLFSSENAYDDIAIIAKYNEAKEILKELIHNGYSIAAINLETEEINNYHDEYIISILNIDGESSVWCDKFKKNDTYLNDESAVIYILGNCSANVIKHCKSDIIFEVNIADKDNDMDFSDDKSDRDTHGFTISNTDDNGYRSFSYYSSYPLSKNEINKMIKAFTY